MSTQQELFRPPDPPDNNQMVLERFQRFLKELKITYSNLKVFTALDSEKTGGRKRYIIVEGVSINERRWWSLSCYAQSMDCALVARRRDDQTP